MNLCSLYELIVNMQVCTELAGLLVLNWQVCLCWIGVVNYILQVIL